MASGIKDIAKKDVQVEAKDGLSGSPPRAVESAVRNLSVVASNRHLPTPTMVSPSLRTEAPVQEAVLLKLGRTAMTRRNNQAAGPDPGPKVVPRVRRNGTSSKGRTKSRSRGRRTSSSRGPSHSRSRSRDPHGTVRFQSPPEQEMPGGTWADRVRNGGTPDGKISSTRGRHYRHHLPCSIPRSNSRAASLENLTVGSGSTSNDQDSLAR
ncbi:hypothetical protein MTO96_037145 [Rhipicephalus appendiculatus]